MDLSGKEMLDLYFQFGMKGTKQSAFFGRGIDVTKALRSLAKYRDEQHPGEILFVRVLVERDDGIKAWYTAKLGPGERAEAAVWDLSG